jgi:outer membrane protein TolC
LPTTLDDRYKELENIQELFDKKSEELNKKIKSKKNEYNADTETREKTLQNVQKEISKKYGDLRQKSKELKQTSWSLESKLRTYLTDLIKFSEKRREE